jgi:hypothetical protein
LKAVEVPFDRREKLAGAGRSASTIPQASMGKTRTVESGVRQGRFNLVNAVSRLGSSCGEVVTPDAAAAICQSRPER